MGRESCSRAGGLGLRLRLRFCRFGVVLRGLVPAEKYVFWHFSEQNLALRKGQNLILQNGQNLALGVQNLTLQPGQNLALGVQNRALQR